MSIIDINISNSELNYLKTIYDIQKYDEDIEFIKNKDIINKLNIKPSSITEMILKLKNKKLLNYKKYHGFKLTDLGLEYCENIFELDEDILKDNRKYLTIKGLFVDSRAEVIISLLLDLLNIKYETNIYIEDLYIKPDFYIKDKDIYIEYWGMNTPEYIKNKIRKKRLYKEYELYLINIEMDEIYNIPNLYTKLYNKIFNKERKINDFI